MSDVMLIIINVILTSAIGLVASVVYFRYTRQVKREDSATKKIEEERDKALAKLVDERHGVLINKFDETKKTIVNKLEAHCISQEKWQNQVDDRFFSHGHTINVDENIADDIIIRKYAK